MASSGSLIIIMILFFKHSYNIFKEKGFIHLIRRAFRYLLYLQKLLLNNLSLFIAKFFSTLHKEKLRNILSLAGNKPTIIILGTHSWFYPMFQRPPQLAKALAKKNCTVFYYYKFPTKNIFKGFYEVFNDCFLSFRLDLLLKLKQKKIFYTVSYDLETELGSLSNLIQKGNLVIYDYLDEIHPDINQKLIDSIKIEKHNKILMDERFIVLATAEKLYKEVSYIRKNNKYLLPNACDYEHFSQNKKIKFSPDYLSILNRNKPIIGYYGTIAKWFDFELLIYLAEKRKDYEFVLIGLIGDNSVYDYDFSYLKNLTFHKPVKYQDLPAYAHTFNISMIPFRNYSVTQATSPIKLFEYMAICKPIVSTDLAECKKYKSVLIANSYEEFAEQIDYGLKLKNDDTYFDVMKKEAKENSWDNRADKLLEIIGKV